MAIPISQVTDTTAVSAPSERVGARVAASSSSSKPNPAIYAALFSQGRNDTIQLTTMEWDILEAKHNELMANSSLNWCLWSINGAQDDGSTTWYTGLWRPSLRRGNSLATFRDWANFKRHNDKVKPNMRLLDFDVTTSRGLRWYIGTWGDSPQEQRLVVDMDWAQFTAEWKTLTKSADKWRLMKIQTYPATAKKTWHVAGLFEKGYGDGWDNMSGESELVCVTNLNEFLQKHRDFEKNGVRGRYMRLRDFQMYEDFLSGKRYYIGVYLESTFPCRALFGESWENLSSQIDALRFSESLEVYGITRYYTNPVPSIPRPDWKGGWEKEFQDCVGYCGWKYEGGNVTSIIAGGLARAKQDWPPGDKTIDGTKFPEKFTGMSRVHLASVSKPITGYAVVKLLQDLRQQTGNKLYNIDTPFYDFVSYYIPDVGPGVKKVTVRNLLQMRSGMAVRKDDDPRLDFSDMWVFLRGYLKDQSVNENDRGFTERYTNTNFTILQAVISALTRNKQGAPGSYVDYVTNEILRPMGIDTTEFSATPVAKASEATLYYNVKSKPVKGHAFGPADGVAAAGWISSARQLGLFLIGVRNRTGLLPSTYETMMSEGLGWEIHDGVFGQYFFHLGGFGAGSEGVDVGLSNIIIVFPNSTSALMLTNMEGHDVLGAMVRTYERGFGRAPEMKSVMPIVTSKI